MKRTCAASKDIVRTDMKAVNSAAEEKVKPVERTDARMDGGLLSLSLKPASFVTIVLKKQAD